MILTSAQYAILGYVVGGSLLWGYAASLWWAQRKG